MARLIALVAAVAVALPVHGLLLPAPPAAALSSESTAPVVLPPLPDLDVEPSDFAGEARALPESLTDALSRDVGLTGAEYLAEAELAIRGADAVDALLSAGVDVEGSRIDDGEFIVSVATEAEVAQVEALGIDATAEGPVEIDVSDIRFEAMADLHGGAPYVYSDGGDSFRCSAGFTGIATGSGARQMITAGHCLGDPAAPRRMLTMTGPNQTGVLGLSIGLPVPDSFRAADGWDFGLVSVPGPEPISRPSVLTWGGGAGSPTASAPLTVRDAARAVVGATICKSGSTTGWTCGPIRGLVEAFVEVDPISGDGYAVDALMACITLGRGDSGGAAVVGSTAVGITSALGADADGSFCGRAGAPIGLFAPLVAPQTGYQSAQTLYGSGWEPLVAVSKPTISSFSSGQNFAGDVISGTVPNGRGRHRVEIAIDGGAKQTVAVAGDGTWKVDVAGLAAGSHSISVVARWGARSSSSAMSATWNRFSSIRVAGDNRYDTAARISQRAFPDGARTVFIANGLSFADALSAGPAAAALGGPLLLTDPMALPDAAAAEIRRLDPDRIIVVGGAGVVSSRVAQALLKFAPVERWAGTDRYSTSREIARRAFGSASIAYVATGSSFPDALSAGAMGANVGAPVLLVPGSTRSVDSSTARLLRDLGVTEARIAGGTGAVSSGIATSLRSHVRTVRRLAGSDRYGTSLALNADVVDRAPDAYVTSGTNFPDALAGSVLAGLRGSPMYIAPRSCVPSAVVDHIRTTGAARLILFGGSSVLGGGVARMDRC